ncbi:MAG TPA: ABC transporter substrate-binding protein [Solirubrobacterales bacterium]|jgi:NitT/TauT family transport system substrate-binding protein/putative hydroxymethylpyrimidine transport system substrate-binding protein|nr:ABC transporter substrate-binding protein [Solirubrobacterales bacterium]
MRVVAALLAAAVAFALAACGDDGAEPGAPKSATLMLDFQPNAVHAGIYSALRRGLYEAESVELDVREPSASTDAPKLLGAGRAEFAIMDIHDLGIAREQGAEVVGVAAIVGRPLAAVIAADRDVVRRPRDLEGQQAGVTGLPSDDAVLDSVVASDGGDPDAVDRVTIGFEAVSALSAGRLDAATAFWNAEGVTLRRLDIPTREFRVDDHGAPRYPELVLTTTDELVRDDPELIGAVVAATVRGYEIAARDPRGSLDDLVAEARGTETAAQRAQLRALLAAGAFRDPGRLELRTLAAWSRWDARNGILERPLDPRDAFDTRWVD